MRVRCQLPAPWLACLVLAAAACSAPQLPPAPWSAAAPPAPSEPAAEAAAEPAPERSRADPTPFSRERAWAHLEALAAIGPRVMGTSGAARAREYILAEIEELGLERQVQEFEALGRRGAKLQLANVAAVVPGESEELFLVAVPYDTRAYESFENLGIDDGGSGVAVALELARVLAENPLPYTTWFVFLDGEQPPPGEEVPHHAGGRAFATALRDRGALEQVRLALVVNRVCDPDLHIARDLLSHRVYREEFWRAAARLGFDEAFSLASPFDQPDGSHRVLVGAGVRRTVALADPTFGGEEPPGLYAGTEDDDLEHCSDWSLGAVGAVSLEAMQSIAQRLRRIDRFAKAPLTGAEVMRLEHLTRTAAEDEPQDEPPAPPQRAAERATPESGAAEPPATQVQVEEAAPPEAPPAETSPTAPPSAAVPVDEAPPAEEKPLEERP